MAYSNGAIPQSALRPVAGGGYLAPEAAAAWNALAAHVYRELGVKIAPNGPDSTYRSLARQQYWRDYWCSRGLCGNAAIVGTSNHGLGLAVDTDDHYLLERYGAPFGYQKAWSDACVPLNTQILTRRGWCGVDDLRDGDETIGYDPGSGTSRWTPIVGVYRSEAEVFRYEHSHLTLEATANHRWLTTGRVATGIGARLEAMDSIEQRDPQARLLLAAPFDGGDGLPISPEEAALIGWGLTDGSIYRFQTATRGKRAFVRVYQTKAVGVAAVDSLMENFEHRRDEDYNASTPHQCTMWYVGRKTFSPILHRSRLDELGTVRFVLALDPEQRRAFLDAVRMAEGGQQNGLRQVAQASGERRDAIALAAALEGHLVALRPRTVNLKRPRIQRDRMSKQSLGLQPVWCVETGLGSWLAEQSGHIFLTGNSQEPWHYRYEAGHYSGADPGPDYKAKPPRWYKRLGKRIEQLRKRRQSKRERRRHGDPTASRKAQLHRQIQRLGNLIDRLLHRRKEWQ